MAKIKLYIAAAAAFILGLVGIYFRGKLAGKEDERSKHLRRRVDAMKTQKEIRDEIWDDIDIADRAGKWVRSDDKR